MNLLSQQLVRAIIFRIANENNRIIEAERFKNGMVLIKMEAILKYPPIIEHAISVEVTTRFEIAVGASLAGFVSTLQEYVRLTKEETSTALEKFIEEQ